MNAHEWVAAGVTMWGPALVDHLWQSTLMALLIFGASMAIRRGSAGLRHTLWLFALVKFLVPTGLIVFLAQQAGIDPAKFSGPDPGAQVTFLHGISAPVTSIVHEVTVRATATVLHNEVYCALLATWLIGTMAFLVIWATRRRKFFSALKNGRRAEDGREWQALERARAILNWETKVTLVIVADKTEPAVCRVWKPVLLLPQAIAGHLNDAELEAIMLHELIHIRRRDNLVGNLQMVVCALLWFHPLVWLISSRLFDERELACDEEVLKLRAEPDTYAAGILKVVRFSMGWRVAGVTGAGSGSNLRRRIENIMSTNNSTRGAAWYRWLAGTVVGFALVLMVVAGLYTRTRNVSAAVHNIDSETTAGVDPLALTTATDEQGSQAKSQQPPAPPKAPNAVPALPPAPPASQVQATTPIAPTVPAVPALPIRPTTPAAAVPSTPPAAPVAPVPPVKEKNKPDKLKSKYKNKEKDTQDKVEKGGLIEAPHPVYPAEAKEKKVEGRVTVDIVIGEEGKVISARPTSGPSALHAAARDAALKARFHPTALKGKPVKVSGALSYNFVLDK